jgi:hypothetical protein
MSKEAPQQIADMAISRIHTITNRPGNLTLGTLRRETLQQPAYVGQLEALFKAEPQLFAQTVVQYMELTHRYNYLVQANSPHLTLFPQLEETQNALNQFAGRNTLPSLEELQKLPNWEQILHNGVEKAATRIELGNYIASKKDSKIVQRIQTLFHNDQIVAPSRSGLETRVINTAVVGHVMERIYLAWLEDLGYEGKKEDIMKVFDAMVMYDRLREKTSNPKPTLDPDFTRLGWVKDEQFDVVKRSFKETLLAERKKGRVYFTSSDERELRRIDPHVNLIHEKTKRDGFQLFLPVSLITQNGFTFCLHRCRSWRPTEQEYSDPYYILETVFKEDEGGTTITAHPLTGERLPNDETINYILPRSRENSADEWFLFEGTGGYQGRVHREFESAGIAFGPLMESVNEIISGNNKEPQTL